MVLARVVELVDTGDLKSPSPHGEREFESRPGHPVLRLNHAGSDRPPVPRGLRVVQRVARLPRQAGCAPARAPTVTSARRSATSSPGPGDQAFVLIGLLRSGQAL